jgi:glucose-6-phosphate 1-dehydrogenase
VPTAEARSDILVIFGATGDLARRKLLPALYELCGDGCLDVPIIAVAQSSLSDEGFRRYAREAIESVVSRFDEYTFSQLCRLLSWMPADCADRGTYSVLRERLAGTSRPLFYVGTPPSLFRPVISGLVDSGAHTGGRVMVEKPFGYNLAGARQLNSLLHRGFGEESILRIDHYLGKESVENLVVFRLWNPLLAQVWNADHVASIQITQSETRDVEGRGRFYDSIGAVRDVVQNHLLLLLALLAMDAPADASPEAVRDEQVKVLRAVRTVDRNRVVRGQYQGYTSAPGVAPTSRAETFAALRLDVGLPRWRDVPFYIRAGKGLGTTAIEAVVEFRPNIRGDSPGAAGSTVRPNLVRFRIGRDAGVTITVNMKQPGRRMVIRPVDLRMDIASLGRDREAYVRLLDDALDGDTRRFARGDTVEEAWRIVEPALDPALPLYTYRRGEWGPREVGTILPRGCWYDPETPAAPPAGVGPDEVGPRHRLSNTATDQNG